MCDVHETTGAEFLARWERGDYAGGEDPAVEGVAMLTPFTGASSSS